MTRFVTRLVAALVTVLVTAMPVASLLCAQECSTPPVAATASDHCHKPAPTSDATVSADEPDGCSSPFIITRLATRDRAGTAVGPAPLVLPPVQERLRLHPVNVVRPKDPRAPAAVCGLSFGTTLPLRI